MFQSYSVFHTFKYYGKYLSHLNVKYLHNEEYSTDLDEYLKQIYNINNLDGIRELNINSIDVEVFKFLFPSIEFFSGNIEYQSYKGNYLTPNYKIFSEIINSCKNLKHMTLNSSFSFYNNKNFVLDLTTLYNSSLEEIIVNSNKIDNLEIIFNDNLPIRPKKLNIKMNINNKFLDKFNDYNIFIKNSF